MFNELPTYGFESMLIYIIPDKVPIQDHLHLYLF